MEMNPVVKFKLVHKDARVPKYSTIHSSGMDLRAIDVDDEILKIEWEEDGFTFLEPSFNRHKPLVFRTGLQIEIPNNFEGQVRPRSGLAFKDSISIINTPGTIDADYRGELKIALINLSNKSYCISKYDRIAQLVICPVIQPLIITVDNLSDTDRGTGGFGSTGKF